MRVETEPRVQKHKSRGETQAKIQSHVEKPDMSALKSLEERCELKQRVHNLVVDRCEERHDFGLTRWLRRSGALALLSWWQGSSITISALFLLCVASGG